MRTSHHAGLARANEVPELAASRSTRRDQVRLAWASDSRQIWMHGYKAVREVLHSGGVLQVRCVMRGSPFTDSPFTLAQAEAQHRAHAVIEQINADLIAGPLAHLPSGRFNANAA